MVFSSTSLFLKTIENVTVLAKGEQSRLVVIKTQFILCQKFSSNFVCASCVIEDIAIEK